MEAVADRGGAVGAIEQGFQKSEIERAAYEVARQIDRGERVVVGVNRFALDEEEAYAPLRVDPAIEAEQAARLADLRRRRDAAAVETALAEVRAAAQRHRQRAAAAETRARGVRDRRRGLRRAPRRLGHLPADRPLLSPRPSPQFPMLHGKLTLSIGSFLWRQSVPHATWETGRCSVRSRRVGAKEGG